MAAHTGISVTKKLSQSNSDPLLELCCFAHLHLLILQLGPFIFFIFIPTAWLYDASIQYAYASEN